MQRAGSRAVATWGRVVMLIFGASALVEPCRLVMSPDCDPILDLILDRSAFCLVF